MNGRQLQNLGVPADCVKSAVAAIQNVTKIGGLRDKQVKEAVRNVVADPHAYVDDEHFGSFAKDVIADREYVRPDPISYRTWGRDIDPAAHGQMKQACGVPGAAGAALMPDAHVGYGLPIGGVLAMGNKYTWKAVQGDLKKKGVTVLSAGADEVPGAYKKIEDVMAAQSGLVEIVSRFDPRIVKMCDDGSKAED